MAEVLVGRNAQKPGQPSVAKVSRFAGPTHFRDSAHRHVQKSWRSTGAHFIDPDARATSVSFASLATPPPAHGLRWGSPPGIHQRIARGKVIHKRSERPPQCQRTPACRQESPDRCRQLMQSWTPFLSSARESVIAYPHRSASTMAARPNHDAPRASACQSARRLCKAKSPSDDPAFPISPGPNGVPCRHNRFFPNFRKVRQLFAPDGSP